MTTAKLPTPRQQQHREFMKQALAAAPKNLSPREKMSWAAAAWRRQSATKVGGMTHPGFSNVAKSIAEKEHIPLVNADAILASSTRRSSVKAKTNNPRLRKVRGNSGAGVFSSIVKAAPHVLKGVQLASKIAARVIGDKNQTASDILDLVGGMGIKRQKQDRAKKLTDMRKKQRIR